MKKNTGKGKLVFMDRETLDIQTELEVSDLVIFNISMDEDYIVLKLYITALRISCSENSMIVSGKILH